MKKIRSGKVRDIYETNNENELLIQVSDRVSAFDFVLNQNISNKGELLNLMSYRWFDMMQDIVDNHIVKKGSDFTIVKKSTPLPIECIVRGYLSGTSWLEYKDKQKVCGIDLPHGLKESSKLPEPIFTPSTKSDTGHDENIQFEEVVNIVGTDISNKIKDYSLKIYKRAFDYAYQRDIIIADTKFEFGIHNNEIILIDEVLTPDSSRFWDKKLYKEGESQPSFDKQIIRDYLLKIGWNKKLPIPDLPDWIINQTSSKYKEIFNKLFNLNIDYKF